MHKQQFIQGIYELAFGDNAINKNYSYKEVYDRIKEYSEKSFEFETIQEEKSYVITFAVINNDTYADDTWSFEVLKIPNNVENWVMNKYDGVHEPCLNTIRIYELMKRRV